MASWFLGVRSLWWVVRFIFWVIVCATFGVTLLVVHPVWWMVRAIARLANGDHSLRADGAVAISQGAPGQGAKIVPTAEMRWPSLQDVAISVREASEALFAYERRMFRARSEMREAATRTLEAIAQTRALMAQLDTVDCAPLGPLGQTAGEGKIKGSLRLEGFQREIGPPPQNKKGGTGPPSHFVVRVVTESVAFGSATKSLPVERRAPP